MSVEYVEVRGKTVDVAVAAAMQELGVENRERIEVEVVQEPEKGFLGFGGQDAVVRVSLRQETGKRRRRRRKRKSGSDSGGEGGKSDQQRSESAAGEGQSRSGRSGGARGGGGDRTGNRQGGRQGDRNQGERSRGGRSAGGRDQSGRRGRDGGTSDEHSSRGGRAGGGSGDREGSPDRSGGPGSQREEKQVAIEEQVPVVEEFLTGLVGSFGLDGSVEVGVDEDVIVAVVNGSQTGAMVGPRGSVIEAIHELTKTVLHRKTESSARLRLDIAGYAERRREALSIYAGQLIDQVLDEGGEVMLEPMSAADRKVIHDAVAAREGVRSYSEGEAPKRYVVIAGTEESAAASSEEE